MQNLWRLLPDQANGPQNPPSAANGARNLLRTLIGRSFSGSFIYLLTYWVLGRHIHASYVTNGGRAHGDEPRRRKWEDLQNGNN
jgi:hypothetical protein